MSGDRLLNGVLALHDVRDVENFARAALEDMLRRWGAALRPDMYEDALSYVIATTYALSLRWDDRKSFAAYAGPLLRKRVVDWYRATLGDSRYGPPEPPLSLDGYTLVDDGGERAALGERLPAPEPVDGEPMGLVVAALRGDASIDCSPDLVRLLEGRDRDRARDTGLLRRASDAIARERNQEQRERRRLARPALPPWRDGRGGAAYWAP